MQQLHRYFSNFHVSQVTQLCATEWRMKLGVLRKYKKKTKTKQVSCCTHLEYSTLKSEIVVMASTTQDCSGAEPDMTASTFRVELVLIMRTVSFRDEKVRLNTMK